MILIAGAAMAAPSFLGPTGNILTPNDSIVGNDTVSVNFHQMDLDSKTSVLGGVVGVTPNIELGISGYNTDTPGEGTDAVFNGKYVLLAEKPETPSITVGVVDATGQIDPDDNVGAYLVLGKNLTPAFSNITGAPVQPLRGYLGVGSGLYRGPWVAFDWAFSPKASLVLEYISKIQMRDALQTSSDFNAALRFTLTSELRADVAVIDSKDFGYGISYVHSLK